MLQIHVSIFFLITTYLAMFLNTFFPDSQNWIVFQPNIIIDAKLGKHNYICTIVASAEMCAVARLAASSTTFFSKSTIQQWIKQ